MINKQNLWFITLFSLIMVLSIYYLTMGEDSLSTLNVNSEEEDTQVVISQNDTLVALKVAQEEELVTKINELEDVLLDNTATIEEKNKAYEDLQNINKWESIKESIVKKIKEEFKLDSIVEIKDNNLKITISSTKHDVELANKIMRCVEELVNQDMYISIKFGS